MEKSELKRLSKKYLGSESKYVKLMENGIMVPTVETHTNDSGEIKHYQVFSKGVPLFEKKRYTLDDVVALFSSFEKEEAEKQEKERIQGLAKLARKLTGISGM